MTHKYKIGEIAQLTKWDYSQIHGKISALTTQSINGAECPTYEITTDNGLEHAFEEDIQILVINPMFRKLLVEGEQVDIDEFIAANTAPDVEPLTDEEIESVRTMNVGDVLYFGMMCEVKRIY